jgi:hypothetical protein
MLSLARAIDSGVVYVTVSLVAADIAAIILLSSTLLLLSNLENH